MLVPPPTPLSSTTTTSRLFSSMEQDPIATTTSLSSLLDNVLHQPVVWSTLAMLSIVALLLAWEESIAKVKKEVPDPLLPVVDSMLAEVGGLGFIGLFLATFVTGGGPLGHIVEHLSEHYLGEDEILLETFEIAHNLFFQIGVGFFLVAGLIVADALFALRFFGELFGSDQLIQKSTNNDDDPNKRQQLSLCELADALDVTGIILKDQSEGQLCEAAQTEALRNSEPLPVWAPLFGETDDDIKEEGLVIRERMIRLFNLPYNFKSEKYVEQTFGHDLEEIVELSPITWLPLIPIFAIANSVDLAHGVATGATSSNAFVTAGEFLTNPLVLSSRIAVAALTLTWSLFNYWKMTSIKNMLVATLVRAGGPRGEAMLLKPRYEDDVLRSQFNSSPGIVTPLERSLTSGKPARNSHEELFGAAGADGPKLYRNSIKFHTWLCVAQIVEISTQIVALDVSALTQGSTVMAHPEAVLPEALLYGFFVVLCLWQLSLAPRTFLNYSAATSLELMTKEWALKKALEETLLETKLQEEEENALNELAGYRQCMADNGMVTASANTNGSSNLTAGANGSRRSSLPKEEQAAKESLNK